MIADGELAPLCQVDAEEIPMVKIQAETLGFCLEQQLVAALALAASEPVEGLLGTPVEQLLGDLLDV